MFQWENGSFSLPYENIGNKSDELRDPPSSSDVVKIEVKYSWGLIRYISIQKINALVVKMTGYFEFLSKEVKVEVNPEAEKKWYPIYLKVCTYKTKGVKIKVRTTYRMPRSTSTKNFGY